jgi:hypothetical protein
MVGFPTNVRCAVDRCWENRCSLYYTEHAITTTLETGQYLCYRLSVPYSRSRRVRESPSFPTDVCVCGGLPSMIIITPVCRWRMLRVIDIAGELAGSRDNNEAIHELFKTGCTRETGLHFQDGWGRKNAMATITLGSWWRRRGTPEPNGRLMQAELRSWNM